MNNDKKLRNIIEALSMHPDSSAVSVLEEVGTNSQDSEIRSLTAKALIARNTKDALSVIISKKGKGINDLNANVAMSTINDILAIDEKDEVLKVLEETEKNNEDESIRDTARSVKTLMLFS